MRFAYALIACVTLASTQALAQEVDAEAPEALEVLEVVYSPEDDLNCALYSSALLGMMGETAMTTQQGAGVLAGLAYFLGRWESVRGGDLTEAMRAQYPAFVQQDGQALAQTCGGRMQVFGGNMQTAGAALMKLEEEALKAEPSE